MANLVASSFGRTGCDHLRPIEKGWILAFYSFAQLVPPWFTPWKLNMYIIYTVCFRALNVWVRPTYNIHGYTWAFGIINLLVFNSGVATPIAISDTLAGFYPKIFGGISPLLLVKVYIVSSNVRNSKELKCVRVLHIGHMWYCRYLNLFIAFVKPHADGNNKQLRNACQQVVDLLFRLMFYCLRHICK